MECLGDALWYGSCAWSRSCISSFYLDKDPQILAFLYDKITVPQSLHFITNFKWLFNLIVVCVTAIPAAAVLYVSEWGFSRCAQAKEK